MALAAAVSLALWAAGLAGVRRAQVAAYAAEGWGAPYAEVIVRNKIVALIHAAGMMVVAAAFLALRRAPSSTPHWARARRAAAWLVVALVAGDAVWLSRHYIHTIPVSAFQENEVIRLLKKHSPQSRVALLTQEGFYNWWLSVVFPYHGIRTVNVPQMPRMPTDYRTFLQAVGRNPLRLWQLTAGAFLLAPAEAWHHLQAHPAWKEAFDVVYAYRVMPSPNGVGVDVLPSRPGDPAQHVVLRLRRPAPRYALIADWEITDDAEALRRLVSPEFAPLQRVLVAPEHAIHLPARDETTNGEVERSGLLGEARLLSYRPGEIEVDLDVPCPSILRAADKFDPNWKAWVDGQPSPVLRVDYLFLGVPLPAGRHLVTLRYAPDTRLLYAQGAGVAACVLAALWLAVARFLPRGRPSTSPASPPK